MASLDRSDIDVATRGAEQFIQLYYPAYDSKDRVESLPKFYRPGSSVIWNGNPIQGNEEVRKLMETMPPSKHEVQSFDCHPIPNSTPPSLLVTVAGTVMHGKPATFTHPVLSRTVDDLPRVFSQVFMLMPDTEAGAGGDATGGHVKYFVHTDNMRFVG